MAVRTAIVSFLALALATATVEPAAAGGGGGEAFVGGLLGSAIGTAIVNQQQRRVVDQRRYVTRRAPAPVVNPYMRQQNSQIQTALNYFGFPAGVPDGVLGGNSRAAIGQYQAFLGYPATGVLSEYERAFLTSSYDRALVGGPQAAQIMTTSGQGTRGLLLAYRQEQMGIPPATATMPVVAAAPVAAPVPEPVVVPQAAAVATPVVESVPAAVAPEVIPASTGDAPATAPAAAGGLPSFLPGAAAASIDSYCNHVNLATSTNGGFVSVAAMNDPTQALGEQFCLARTYAIEQGNSLAGTVQGFSMAEMEVQCQAFAPAMTGYQARLASQDPAEVRAALQDFVSSTGTPPAQMSGSARICLGIGYRTDDAEVALASAMVLVGLGEEAYDELLGHHLMNGFATPKRADRGLEWLAAASEALAAGASPLVANGSQAHAALLQQAVAELVGGAPAPLLQDAAAAAPLTGLALPMAPAQPASN